MVSDPRTLVHDPRTPYFGYELSHHRCVMHLHLRSLQYIEKLLRSDLGSKHGKVTVRNKKGNVRQETDNHNLSPEQIRDFEQRYDIIVNKGYEANSHPP